MMHVKYDENYTAYKNLKPGDTFIFDSSLRMVIDETDKGTEEKTYVSVVIETGKVSHVLSNGSLVKKVECEVSFNQ